MINAKELQERLAVAKQFLNAELTHLRVNDGLNSMSLLEVGQCKDTLHEAERVGLRNLTDMHFIKIQRVLTSVEARMSLSKN